MSANLAADAVVIIHFLFILFIVFGGFLVLRWRRIAWLHVPCALWGVLIEFFGWICPLTPLENRLRALAFSSGYGGGFIEHYLMPVVYPESLTRMIQLVMGVSVIAINLSIYGSVLCRGRGRSKHFD